MKVTPLTTAVRPAYPTMTQARQDARLIVAAQERAPHAPRLGALCSAGVLAQIVAAANLRADAPAPQPAVAAVPQPGAEQADAKEAATIQQVSAQVAPILAEALEFDGRGAFGCVAVNPPVVLPEDEALDVIQSELAAAGLSLEFGVPLDGIETPVEDTKSHEDGLLHRGKSSSDFRVIHEPRRHNFDFADQQRGIYIEYLSLKDHEDWCVTNVMSTVSSYDFPGLTRNMAPALEKYKADNPVLFGLFFDPLAHEDMPALAAGRDNDKPLNLTVARERAAAESANRDDLDAIARERLRRQVQYFVAYLREQGLLAAKP